CRARSTSSVSSSGRPSTKATSFPPLHTPRIGRTFPLRSPAMGEDRRFVVDRRLGRFALYGAIGWCAEVLFTGIHDYVRHRDRRLPSRTSIWMFPVYGLMQPLYEPVHDAVRERPTLQRAV